MSKIPLCNKDSLDNTIKRDNAILLEKYKKVTKNMLVHFRCNCGEESYKNCLQLVKVSGAFCKACTKARRVERLKKTNLERYGVECTVHAPKIKEQIIKNNLEKYGVENVFQSSDIKEKIKQTFKEKYGVEHPSKSKDIIEKRKKISIEQYGVENPMQRPEIKEKVMNTTFERYGVKHCLQSKEVQEKAKQTNLKRFGTEYASQSAEFREKFKETCLKKYGVTNPNKTTEIKEKIKQTNLQRYGVEHSSQNLEVMEKTQKNAKRLKDYTMPSGEIRKVQGFEPFALDCLVKTYQETDILTQRKVIPRIPYKINEKQHYYYPDIFIPSENKIIEVKSTWTYKCKADNIPHKTEATKAAGYNYEIWVYDGKGNKTVY